MRRIVAVAPLVLAVVLMVVPLFCTSGAHAASKRVLVGGSKPNPTPTPQPNTKMNGVAFVSPQPACTAGQAGTYTDANGCLYSCTGGKVSIVARALSNTCAYPTTGATATPTPTVTATP